MESALLIVCLLFSVLLVTIGADFSRGASTEGDAAVDSLTAAVTEDDVGSRLRFGCCEVSELL